MGVLLLAAAGLSIALARARFSGWRRQGLLLGGAGVALLVRGIGTELLLLTGALDDNTAIRPEQRYWASVLWNPWFVAGGLTFGLATLARARSAP